MYDFPEDRKREVYLNTIKQIKRDLLIHDVKVAVGAFLAVLALGLVWVWII
jgi:hypothetical protein